MLFHGLRIGFKRYKQIFRYGTMYAFTWEILAGGMGAVLLVGLVILLSKVFYVMEIPFATLVAFAAVYMLAAS